MSPLPMGRCENCRRVVTPVKRVALLVEGEIVRERSMCTACLCNWRELIQEPAPWIGAPPKSGAA